MKILVSGCLVGNNCKYNGGNNYNARLMEYLKEHEVFVVCPEVLGGLPTPRVPSEIVNGIVMNREGTNVDKEFHKGAEIALEIAKKNQVDLCILQSRSPSCGSKEVYDGTFSGHKIKGMGVFAKSLKENGFRVMDVEDL